MIDFNFFYFWIAKFYSRRASARSTKTLAANGRNTIRVPQIYRTPKTNPQKRPKTPVKKLEAGIYILKTQAYPCLTSKPHHIAAAAPQKPNRPNCHGSRPHNCWNSTEDKPQPDRRGNNTKIQNLQSRPNTLKNSSTLTSSTTA